MSGTYSASYEMRADGCYHRNERLGTNAFTYLHGMMHKYRDNFIFDDLGKSSQLVIGYGLGELGLISSRSRNFYLCI